MSVEIRNRPFATEPVTGMQLPDGIFDATLGTHGLNAYVRNTGADTLVGARIYIEATSHPGLAFAPQTHNATLFAGAARLFRWRVDCGSAPVGTHYVSFVVESAGRRYRLIKKIIVTKTAFDAGTGEFTVDSPEYQLRVSIHELFGPAADPCQCEGPVRPKDGEDPLTLLSRILRNAGEYPPRPKCAGNYALRRFSVAAIPTPAYTGQFGELPFQDPWWKTLLMVLAVILIIAAIIVAFASGIGEVVIGPGLAIAVTWTCCATPAAIAATVLGAGGMVAAIAAAFGDDRDPVRRGQDNTPPDTSEELTVREELDAELFYVDPIICGTPFSVGTRWTYTRVTREASGAEKTYDYSVDEVNQNQHLLDHYEVDAADVVRAYQRERWEIRARFFEDPETFFTGGDLFVLCFLEGPNGQELRLVMQDDGIDPDDEANDGWYTAAHLFPPREAGLWKYTVIAQDINDADASMTPEEAAKVIGGQVLTGQLTITFTGDVCPLVQDGHVNVLV